MPYSRFTSGQIDEMRALSKQGWSSVKIGKKYGADHATILHHLGRLKRMTKYKLFKKEEFPAQEKLPAQSEPKIEKPRAKNYNKFLEKSQTDVNKKKQVACPHQAIRTVKGRTHCFRCDIWLDLV